MDQHPHRHGPTRNIKTAFFLNLGFTLIEIIGGFITNSTAILADAVHDLGDSIALGQAWYFERFSGEKGNIRYTYGYRRFSLFGAIVSTIILLCSSVYIVTEALPRIFSPEPTNAQGMVVLAVFGIAVNGFAMLRLKKDEGINARVVSLHLLEDVLGWIAVLIVAVVLLFTDISVLDPLLAIAITFYILYGVIKNLRKMVPIILQAAPENIDIASIVEEITGIEHVNAAHHAHLWSMDGQHTVFSVHLEVDKELDPKEYGLVKQIMHDLVKKHGIYHSTVEIEFPDETCRNIDNEECR